MKRLILLFLLCATGLVNAQIVNIPDANFKAALIAQGVDTNADGDIQESEAAVVTGLFVEGFNISDLTGISSFVNLIHLDCSDNQLTSLDVSSNINLTWLECSQNQLTALDVSNNINLESLGCSHNQLTSLDVSSLDALYDLTCNNNQLTSLNTTNCSNLWSVICDNNQLTSLEIVGLNAIEFFIAANNNITELDLSNYFSDLYIFTFYSNPIEYINIKNGVINDVTELGIDSDVQFICVDDDELSETINNISGDEDFENAVVTTYCTFTPVGNYNTITGEIYFDIDNDGCDTGDIIAIHTRIEINDGTESASTYANSTGQYEFYTQMGNFTLTPSVENPTWFNVSPETASIPFADNENNTATQDFCITAVGIHNDVEIVINPIVPAQPGFDAIYQIIYKNKGNQAMSGDINFLFDDTVLDYISATVIPDGVATGSLTWNYTDLVPFETRSFMITLNVNSPMETPPVNIGDILSFTAYINPSVTDETPNDNSFNLNQTVIGSYDPNDKTCLEGESLVPEMIGDYLHYNINFENTGTAPATFVVVKDEIDNTMFDISTLQVMFASHDMVTTVSGQTVEFLFDNINLGPDEKGNVLFKIKTLGSLEIDDAVTNDAEIFFDYNFPIETNTTVTTFETLSVDEFELDNAISIFPNPVNDVLEINSKSVIDVITIYDVQGRKVLSKTINAFSSSITISSFTSGIYFLNIQTDRGEQVEKIIKK